MKWGILKPHLNPNLDLPSSCGSQKIDKIERTSCMLTPVQIALFELQSSSPAAKSIDVVLYKSMY